MDSDVQFVVTKLPATLVHESWSGVYSFVHQLALIFRFEILSVTVNTVRRSLSAGSTRYLRMSRRWSSNIRALAELRFSILALQLPALLESTRNTTSAQVQYPFTGCHSLGSCWKECGEGNMIIWTIDRSDKAEYKRDTRQSPHVLAVGSEAHLSGASFFVFGCLFVCQYRYKRFTTPPCFSLIFSSRL